MNAVTKTVEIVLNFVLICSGCDGAHSYGHMGSEFKFDSNPDFHWAVGEIMLNNQPNLHLVYQMQLHI